MGAPIIWGGSNTAQNLQESLATQKIQATPSSDQFTLMTTDGSIGQAIITSGSGVLSFGTPVPIGNVAANDSDVIFTAADNRVQVCTPTADRTYTLPTTSIPAGDTWYFYNDSNFFITLNASGGTRVLFIYPQSYVKVVSKTATPTLNSNWYIAEVDGSWFTYTPTMTGFGTPSSVTGLARRSRSGISVSITFTAGTITGTEARFSLPANTTTIAGLPTLSTVGTFAATINNAGQFELYIEPSITYLTAGVMTGANDGLAKRLANVLVANSDIISLKAYDIPIQN